MTRPQLSEAPSVIPMEVKSIIHNSGEFFILKVAVSYLNCPGKGYEVFSGYESVDRLVGTVFQGVLLEKADMAVVSIVTNSMYGQQEVREKGFLIARIKPQQR